MSRKKLAKKKVVEPKTVQSLNFGPLPDQLAYYIRRLQKAYKTHFTESIGDLEVEARDIGALFAIGLNPGLTPSQLAPALFVEAAIVTGMLNAFALRGWIDRRISSADGRSRTLHLTKAGQKLLDKLMPLVVEIDREFIGDSLTKEESAQMIKLLAKVLAGRRKIAGN